MTRLSPVRPTYMCVSGRSLVLLLCSLVLGSQVFAQASRTASVEAKQGDRDRPQLREQWYRRGRFVPGESAAALLARAHQEKMRLRGTRLSEAQRNGTSSQGLPTGYSWVPIGPAPLMITPPGVIASE